MIEAWLGRVLQKGEPNAFPWDNDRSETLVKDLLSIVNLGRKGRFEEESEEVAEEDVVDEASEDAPNNEEQLGRGTLLPDSLHDIQVFPNCAINRKSETWKVK